MRKSRVVAVFLWACCLTLLSVASVKAQGEYEIVPGQRIGLIEMGMNRQAVHSKLGQPTGTYNLPGRGRGDYWISSDNSNTLRVYYTSAGRVYQISVTSPRFTTPEGFNSSSSLAAIQRSYGRLKVLRVSARGDIDYYYDAPRGISFEFTDQLDAHSSPLVMRGYAVLIFRPGTRPQPEPDEHPR